MQKNNTPIININHFWTFLVSLVTLLTCACSKPNDSYGGAALGMSYTQLKDIGYELNTRSLMISALSGSSITKCDLSKAEHPCVKAAAILREGKAISLLVTENAESSQAAADRLRDLYGTPKKEFKSPDGKIVTWFYGKTRNEKNTPPYMQFECKGVFIEASYSQDKGELEITIGSSNPVTEWQLMKKGYIL